MYYLDKENGKISRRKKIPIGGEIMKKRIKDTPVSANDYKNEFFNVYRKEIEFYFGNPKEESVYVEDSKIEKKLMQLISNDDSKIIYFLGKAGIGKTTLLKKYFKLSDNTVVIDEQKKAVFISMSFRGQLVENDISQFVINSISSVCSALEDNYEFRDKFYSIEGHNEFYTYIKETNRQLLEYVKSIELIGKSEQERKLLRMQRGEEENPYMYIATKLDFYVNYYCPEIDNIVLVVDNLEALSYKMQFTAVRNALAFFSNILNIPENTKSNCVKINLILSMRQSTYEHLAENEEINAYNPRSYLYKEDPVDMLKYFEMKKETLTNTNGMEEVWEDAYEIIITLANKFGCKYSEMIKNLSNYDFQVMKKCYKKILTNKVWLLRGERRKDFLEMSKTDYLFNNISVLRSIACGNNAVYRGMKSTVLPNVLLNDEFKDDSILCLLVMCFFIKKREPVKKTKLWDTFQWIFVGDYEIQEALDQIVEYFLEIEILEETYYKKEPIEKNKNLDITPRGREIWNMFISDSVLLEMYREDHYFDIRDNSCNFSSSYHLMSTVGQYEIFTQLFQYINVLIEEEKNIRKKAKRNGKMSEYYSCFGSKAQSKRLLEGVIRSVEYSGNIGAHDIQNTISYLEQKIKNIDMEEECL